MNKSVRNAAQRIRRAITKAYPSLWFKIKIKSSTIQVVYANGPIASVIQTIVVECTGKEKVDIRRKYTLIEYRLVATRLGVQPIMSLAEENYILWMVNGRFSNSEYAKAAQDHLDVLACLSQIDLMKKTP